MQFVSLSDFCSKAEVATVEMELLRVEVWGGADGVKAWLQ